MKMNKFEKKQYEAEILGELYRTCEERLNYLSKSYEKVGVSEEQAKDWNGNLLWEDEEETIPKYREIYDYVPKTELSDEETDKSKVIEEIMAKIEKML